MTSLPTRALGLLAVALGVGGDFLLRGSPPGLGAGLWALAAAGAGFALRRGMDPLARPALAPLLLAGGFGLALALRDSAILQGLFAAAALGAWAIAFLDRSARAGVTSHAAAASAALTSAVLAPILVLAGARSPAAPRLRGRIALAGTVAAAPLLLVFGTLFASADPLFAEYAGDLARSLDDALAHGATALAITWLAGGALAGLALARVPADLDLGRPPRWIAEVALVALGLVATLFAAFLAVQARALVGGRELVEATLGLGYAEYARHGFFQLLAVAGLALPLVLAAEWVAAPGEPRRARIVGLSLALVAMVLAVLASAARRMSLYVDAYGLSELRLYASAAMVWLALALVTFAVAAARGQRRRFALHALVAAVAVVAGLGFLSPPNLIVRVNADRAPSSPAGFDARYATSLGADAVPALLDVLPELSPRPRCLVARELRARAEALPAGDWRGANLARSRARTLLAESSAAIDAAILACPPLLSGVPRRG